MKAQKSPFIGLLEVWLCFSLLWVGLASGNARAQSANVCGPAPAVKAALDQLPQQTPALTDWQFHEQYAAAQVVAPKPRGGERVPDTVFPLLGPGKGRVAHDRVLGLGTNAKKTASGGKWEYVRP